MKDIVIKLFVSILVVFITGCAAVPIQKVPYYFPALQKENSQLAWQQFNKQFDNQWRVQWNEVTGTPHRIMGHYIMLPDKLDEDKVINECNRVINQYNRVLQVDPQQLSLSKISFEQSKLSHLLSGTWYVAYKQVYHGLPVEGGSVRMVIRDNKITRLASDYYPDITISPKPNVSLNTAVKTIRLMSAAQDEEQPFSSQLIIYPTVIEDAVRYYLSWDVIMPVERVAKKFLVDGRVIKDGQARVDTGEELIPVQYRYLLDAHTGKIIDRFNVMLDEDVGGTVTGSVHPKIPADTPEIRAVSSMSVSITQGSITYTDETDVSGDYNVTGLTSGIGDLTAHFEGPLVRVWNNETADPDAEHSSNVTIPGTHDWDWSADDPSPNDVETNAFYHIDHIQRYFNTGIMPFNVIGEPNPMQAYVRDGAYCNAYASPSGLYFGSGQAGCEDFALCADIIYHEYTHRIVNKVYDDAGVSLPYRDQTGAMNEGWADYFGSTNTNDPAHGSGCYSGRNIDTPDFRYPDDYVGSVHSDGRIFSGAIWDVRQDLGAEYIDAMALRAMKEAEISFSNYLGAMLEEDDDPSFSSDPLSANNNPADGTPNMDTICHNYYDVHGIYHTYCANHTQLPVAHIELPSPDQRYNLYDSSATSITIDGTALGSNVSALDHYVLEYAHQDAPSTWLTTGMTLAGGGISPVNSANLGQLNCLGLVDGFYLLRLRVHAVDTTTASFISSFVLDKALMTGWPQLSDTHFYSSPAIADIDPLFSGLEIIILGSDANLYVLHHDGTNAPGWPQMVGYGRASPAVADLDKDGSLEIAVAVSNGNVWVFEQNGTAKIGWPQATGADLLYNTTAIGDLDADGDCEVIVSSPDMNVYAWHHDGTNVIGWPVNVGAEIESSIAIGDLDGNGFVEVVVGVSDGTVYALNGNGTIVTGWPQSTGPATTGVSASPALGDLDGDGDMEIIVGTEDFNNYANRKVYAWNHDGTLFPGWPQDFATPPDFGGFQRRPSSTDLADLDGDGDLEVIIMSNDDNIHVWNSDGSILTGWPPAGPGGNFYEYIISSPVVVDIDGDGDREVIAEASYTEIDRYFVFTMFAFHHDGTLAAGWPKPLPSFSNSSPAIADLDLDGDVEIIIGSDGIMVWDLTGSYDPSSSEWPLYRNDNRRTGAYGPIGNVVLLLDSSGSMSWLPDGSYPPPGDEYKARINLTKQAIYPFLLLLGDHTKIKYDFGVATFPASPSPPFCAGQTVIPMTLVSDPSIASAVSITIPAIGTSNSTPLLAGIQTAKDMVTAEGLTAIVLLSDGYHNCPSYVADPTTDPQVTALINDLNNKNIRVFTIGFGRPTDIDHPMLEIFADQTTPSGYMGSQFYDVTTPTFDPDVWDPATALQATYKSILVDALGLEPITDPLDTISGTSSKSFDISLNEHDRRVSFYVSWSTRAADRLQLTVLASDGLPVPTSGAGIKVHNGSTYKIITVDQGFLTLPGKVGTNPWTLHICSANFSGTEPYQYSVISDSALKMRVGTTRSDYMTGDTIVLTANIREGNRAMTNLTNVYVDVSAPRDGLGNWFANHKVTAAQLATIPQTQGLEKMTNLQRKAHYLTHVQKIPLPGIRPVQRLRLYDDGTHGDAKANDGIYTAQYKGTNREGVYHFHVHANGKTSGNLTFERDFKLSRTINVKMIANTTRVRVVSRQLFAKRKQYEVVVTPRDAFGNHLGPGFSSMLIVQSPQGNVLGRLHDNLDGSYTQVLEVPRSVMARNTNVTIEFKKPVMKKTEDAIITKQITTSQLPEAWIPLIRKDH